MQKNRRLAAWAFFLIIFGIVATVGSTVVFFSTFMMWSPGAWLFIALAPVGLFSVSVGVVIASVQQWKVRREGEPRG